MIFKGDELLLNLKMITNICWTLVHGTHLSALHALSQVYYHYYSFADKRFEAHDIKNIPQSLKCH